MVARGRSIERGEDSSGTSRDKSKGRKGKGRCWYYNKLGHLKKDCWKRKESKDDSKKEANLVESSSGMVDEVLSVCSISQYQEEWLLDFGASHHMCSHRSWFSSYQSIDDMLFLWEMIFLVKLLGLGALRLRCSMVL
jgi:hypothetical protein